MHPASQTFFLENPNFPTIQSIQAQSQYSVDLRPSNMETAIMQILLLSIEVDRKDMIIDQLQNNAYRAEELRRSQIDIQHSDLKHRFQKIQTENRSLIQSNAVLRNKVAMLERATQQIELYKQNGKYNKQLQEKLSSLQVKLKKTQEAKIQSQHRQKLLKAELAKLQYALMVKSSQKTKIRELEIQINTLKSKLQKSQTSNNQNKHLIQKFSQQIHYLKDQQSKLIRNFQQKIQMIKVNEDLKKSQCFAASDEKILLLTQELNRIKGQYERLKQQLGRNVAMVDERNEQIRKLNQDLQCYEKQIEAFQRSHQEYQQMEIYLGNIKQQIGQKQKQIENLRSEIELSMTKKVSESKILKQLEIKYQNLINEDTRKKNIIEVLGKEMSASQEQVNQLRAQIRKLKKSQANLSKQCQICKIKSASNISQKSSMKSLNLDELIKQTEKLKLSNSKIQNLISYHEYSSQNSIQLKANSRITYSNNDKK